MRVFRRAALRFRHAYRVEQFHGAALGGRAFGEAVYFERLADLESDRVHRIEGDHRLLKHEANAPAADAFHGRFGNREEILAFEDDLAGRDAARRLD